VQDQQDLSVRGLHRVLRVARTAADLDGSRQTREQDVATALALRLEAGTARRRTA
jgi:predicted ATPase with chaperone activity